MSPHLFEQLELRLMRLTQFTLQLWEGEVGFSYVKQTSMASTELPQNLMIIIHTPCMRTWLCL